MKVVKANLLLLICGTRVLLALVAIYWPLSSVKGDVLDDAGQRESVAKGANSFDVKVVIPYGNGKATATQPAGALLFTAPPNDAVVKARQEVGKAIKDQESRIN